jgi:uncharacterized membrane protein
VKYFAGTTYAIGAMIASLMSFMHSKNMAERVPMHWNASGHVDRYGNRSEALLFIPIFMLVFAAVFGLIGLISGVRLKVSATKGINIVSAAMVVFFLVVHNSLLLNSQDAMPHMIPFLFSGLLLILGIAIKGIEPNPFIGIRVPWTMKSPMVWRITHDRASKLWICSGVISIILCFVGTSIFITIGIFAIVLVYPIFDSYNISKRV